MQEKALCPRVPGLRDSLHLPPGPTPWPEAEACTGPTGAQPRPGQESPAAQASVPSDKQESASSSSSWEPLAGYLVESDLIKEAVQAILVGK